MQFNKGSLVKSEHFPQAPYHKRSDRHKPLVIDLHTNLIFLVLEQLMACHVKAVDDLDDRDSLIGTYGYRDDCMHGGEYNTWFYIHGFMSIFLVKRSLY